MGAYFFDTSALIKRYVDEKGSSWVAELLSPVAGNIFHAVSITETEVTAALARRAKSPGADPQDLSDAITRFRAEFDVRFRVIQTLSELIKEATELAAKHALRGYDAVQLAAAIRVHAEYHSTESSCILVSSDAELNAAAASEGLRVENPNYFP